MLAGTTPVQESPASIMTFNVPELAEAEETVPAPVDISDNADSLFTPAFNEGAALEQCSMEDSYHSFTAARLSQLGMSAASSGAFRFVGEFDVFTSRDDDEVRSRLPLSKNSGLILSRVRAIVEPDHGIHILRCNPRLSNSAAPRRNIWTTTETRYIFKVY